jgi:hypothetical protein
MVVVVGIGFPSFAPLSGWLQVYSAGHRCHARNASMICAVGLPFISAAMTANE